MAVRDRVILITAIMVLSLTVASLGVSGGHFGRKASHEQRLKQLKEALSYDWKGDLDGTSVKEVDKYSRPKYDPRWFTALSKIARIRTADGRNLNVNEDARESSIFYLPDKKENVDHPMEDQANRKSALKGNLVNGKKNESMSPVHFRPRMFHCHPIQDIYVPKVEKSLPAYVCKLGTRTFVLTSERFLQDRRSHVDIGVDDNTFLRLNSGPKSENSGLQVIPATLVLNKEKHTYGIKRT